MLETFKQTVILIFLHFIISSAVLLLFYSRTVIMRLRSLCTTRQLDAINEAY